MRGPDEQTSNMFSYIVPEQRVRQDHPLRTIRRLTDEVLVTLSPRFDQMYSDIGRPSIPPEQLLRLVFLAHNSFELDQFAKAIGLGVYSAITRFHAVATSGVGVS